MPARYFILREFAKTGERDRVQGRDAVRALLDVCLPDQVDHVKMIKRVDHVLEDRGSFFVASPCR